MAVVVATRTAREYLRVSKGKAACSITDQHRDNLTAAEEHGPWTWGEVELRLDGTEVRVRRPQAGKPGRCAFVSGKMRQNTEKATVITDERGRTLWTGAVRPGRMHDRMAVKTEGAEDLFEQYPQVKAKVDAGYRGLAKQFPDQVQAPPK